MSFNLHSVSSEGFGVARVVHAHKTAILGVVKDAASIWSVSSNGTLRYVAVLTLSSLKHARTIHMMSVLVIPCSSRTTNSSHIPLLRIVLISYPIRL